MQHPLRHVRAYNNAYLRINVPKKRALPNADTTFLLPHVFHQSGHTENLWLTFYRSFSHCITLTLVIVYFSDFLSYIWRIKFRRSFPICEIFQRFRHSYIITIATSNFYAEGRVGTL